MEQDKIEFLANSIKKAKQVMEKVEDGNFQPTNNSQNGQRSLSESDIDKMLDSDGAQFLNEEDVLRQNKNRMQNNQPVNNTNMKNFAKSKMPSAILKSFAENPIADPTAPIGMGMVMNEVVKKVGTVRNENPVNKQNITSTSTQIDTKLMEYIIRKTVEETLEQISKKTSIAENIQIKIGDKTFGGKITTLNEIKTIKKK